MAGSEGIRVRAALRPFGPPDNREPLDLLLTDWLVGIAQRQSGRLTLSYTPSPTRLLLARQPTTEQVRPQNAVPEW